MSQLGVRPTIAPGRRQLRLLLPRRAAISDVTDEAAQMAEAAAFLDRRATTAPFDCPLADATQSVAARHWRKSRMTQGGQT